MSYFLAVFLMAGLPLQASVLNRVIDGIDRTFAGMSDFSADFTQIFQNSLNQRQQETGHLYLMKPGKMRWEYKTPQEKLFVSDGKNVYFYIPADRQVSKEPVKDTLDDRIPLMFLLGRSGLRNEFASFSMLSRKPLLEGDSVIRLVPKRKTDLENIEMEVDPASYLIHRLVLSNSDGTQYEFTFSNLRTNTGIKAGFFDFKVPAGVEVLQGIGQ